MSDLLYATGISIDFSTNGVASLLGLVDAATKANTSLKDLIVTAKQLDATLSGVAKSASGAASAIYDYAAANAASTANSRAAAAANDMQAASFRNVQAAAAGANVEMRASRMLGGSNVVAFPRSNVMAALPSSAMTSSALALGSGQAAFGGGGGALPPGVTGRAYRMGGSGGGVLGGSGGGFGGGGGYVPSYMAPLSGGFGAYGHAATKGLEFSAIAGAGVATDAVVEAGRLQRQLTLIQAATGANAAQMERIKQSAYDLSNATAQSAAQSAQVIGVMASSGINDPAKLTPKFIDTVGKFADMQYLKSGGKVSFEEATKQAIQLAHLYHAYSPAAISPVLEQVNKLSFMMPDNLNKYLTQSSYYAPFFQRYGVPETETLTLGAFLDRMGMGKQKGGSALANFLSGMTKPAELTGTRGKSRVQALEALGLYTNGIPSSEVFHADAKGDSVIDIFKALRVINDKMQKDLEGLHGNAKARKEREDIGLYQKAFGIVGARFGYLGDNKGLEQLFGMVNQLGKMPNIATSQGSFMNNLEGRSQQAFSNFQSLMTEIGWNVLPGATKGFKDLAEALHEAQSWLHKNRGLELEVQKDIMGAVKGTEAYIVSHKAGLLEFRHDMHDVYEAAKPIAGSMLNIASGFGILYEGAKPLMQLLGFVGGAVGSAANWVNTNDPFSWVDPRNWNKDASNMMSRFNQTYGGVTVGGPGGGIDGHRVGDVHVHGDVHLHGLRNPADFARQLHAKVSLTTQHSSGISGHTVTHPNMPNALTIPH